MARATPEPVAIAILAKAPVAGAVKTRLAPVLGDQGAAKLQERLIARTVETARAARIGPVTLWVTPAEPHPFFSNVTDRTVALAIQPDGDLGDRMLAAFTAAGGLTLVIGADCPVLMPAHLRAAADELREGIDAVVIPADDGGYVLIGLREPEPGLFTDMAWSTETVMAETRRRLARLGLSWREPVALWDVDRPEDLDRLRKAGLRKLLGEQ